MSDFLQTDVKTLVASSVGASSVCQVRGAGVLHSALWWRQRSHLLYGHSYSDIIH